MSRLSEVFEKNEKCFIPFVTAGYPDLQSTEEIIVQLAAVGSHIVEIGLPFSDPVADGPVIQRASNKALKHGYLMSDYLELVKRIRKRSDVGLVFMTYCNPVLKYGLGKLDRDAAEAGLDGILISDLTPEEAVKMERIEELDTVFLAAPTSTDERLRMICGVSSGFLYLVARTGVTGGKTNVNATVPGMMKRIRKFTDMPVAAGFGISSASDVMDVWKHTDAAVVGTAIIRYMEEHIDAVDLPTRVATFVGKDLIP